MNDIKNKLNKWMLPLCMAGSAFLLLAVAAFQISTFGDAVLYVASWIIVLHVFVGEYVLLRYVHATSRNQRVLDVLAFILLCGCLLSFHNPSLWSAFLAGVMALATVKYVLIEGKASLPVLRRYAREKIRWEGPSVVVFVLLALAISYLPESGVAVRMLEVLILAMVAGFAVWLIGIRHIYRWVRDMSE